MVVVFGVHVVAPPAATTTVCVMDWVPAEFVEESMTL